MTMGDPPVIDTHTHFYDPTRREGVPWPRPDEPLLYRQVLPRHFREQAGPAGVTRTVVVEASGWLADNDWILDLASHEPCVAGFVGHVEPGETFDAQVGRLASRSLFRGIRLSGAHLEASRRDSTLRAFEVLAGRGLSLDLLVRPEDLGAAAEAVSRFPDLTVIVNHLGGVRIDGAPPRGVWLDGMAGLAALPNVACKVSGFVEAAARRPGPTDADYYRPVLETVLRLFGPDRLLFGSNWPVCELGGSYTTVMAIARAFALAHAPDFARRLFTDNAARLYKIGDR